MEIMFKENQLEYLGITETDTVYQEETTEVTLPDSLPDADRILEIRGTPVVRSREHSGNTCTVNGGLPVTVLYLTENDPTPQRLETYLSFRVKKDIPGAEEGSVQYRIWLRGLDARRINTRKLLIRANLGSEFTLFEQKIQSLASLEAPPSCMQVKTGKYELLLPQTCGEKEVQLSDELPLSENAGEIDEILCRSTEPILTEWKILGNKAVFKGELRVHLLYRDGSGNLQAGEERMPFSQYLELDQEWDDGELVLQPLLTAMEVEKESPNSLAINCSLLVQATVFTKQTVSFTEDAYSTEGSLETEWETPNLPAVLDLQQLRETGLIRIQTEAAEILDHTVLLDRVNVRRDGDQAWLSVPVTVGILYWDEDRQLRWKTGRSEVSCAVVLAENAKCRAEAWMTGLKCTIRDGTVEAACEVQFSLLSRFDGIWKNLSGASITPDQENEQRPSVIVRRVQENGIWEIAKQNRAKVEQICAANHLTGEVVPVGTLLLIPLH